MTDLVLEPYALQQHWSADRGLEPGEWAALLSEYLTKLASACAGADAGPEARTPVIGHIKLLALFDMQEFLRISVVSARHPPTVTGAVPSDRSEMTTTVNVLVYGLPSACLATLTAAVADEVAGRWGVHQTRQDSRDQT